MTPGMHPYEGNGRRTPYLSSIGNGTDGCRQALFRIGLHIWTLPRSPDELRFASCTSWSVLSLHALDLLVQNDASSELLTSRPTVVFDETKPSTVVREKIHTPCRRGACAAPGSGRSSAGNTGREH